MFQVTLRYYEEPSTTENTCTHTSDKNYDKATIDLCKTKEWKTGCLNEIGCTWNIVNCDDALSDPDVPFAPDMPKTYN